MVEIRNQIWTQYLVIKQYTVLSALRAIFYIFMISKKSQRLSWTFPLSTPLKLTQPLIFIPASPDILQ